MLKPRIIPCLLIQNKGLVKTVQFKQPKYVGDPINAVRIFNEKAVDEIMIVDIDATTMNKEPDYKLIENLAAECRMPLCYGGGIKTVEQAQRIFSLGVEKVAFSSAAINTPMLIKEIAECVGSQSVVVVFDVKKNKKNEYEIWTHNGTINTGIEVTFFAKKVEQLGAGEVIINSIDQDGVMKGYDMHLVDIVRSSIHLPLTVLGGAGSLGDIGKLIAKHGIIGAAAGSLFVFKGVFRAVLISYPNTQSKDELINFSFHQQYLKS
ncbi:MAG: AglZ/HisF2 family acetamidino modification protein [Hydrotalea sp.]|nr:AglZ/HisF2 family acetamidino modification protein [Hydrotalea sp.]